MNQFGASWMMSADEPYDRSRVLERIGAALAALEARLQAEGLTAAKPPPLPTQGLIDAFVHNERYRVLVQYDPWPIVGVEDELDDEGDPVYIYGEPCWQARVDTLTE